MARIELDNLINTRDLGGIITKDGHRIKPHKLIRSGQLFFASVKDKDTLVNEYNLSLVVDFRSSAEKEEKPDPKMLGVKYVFNPIMKEITKGITRDKKSDNDTVKMIVLDMANDVKRAEKYMEDIYESIINSDYALNQYAKFIDLLIGNENGASLWHCTAGKDRAGFATFLVLECLGVDKETIIQDYLLTNEYTKKDVNKMIEDIKKDYDYPLIDQVVKALFGIKREYLENIYDLIDREYGSMHNFLYNKICLTDEKINKMRKMFLD